MKVSVVKAVHRMKGVFSQIPQGAVFVRIGNQLTADHTPAVRWLVPIQDLAKTRLGLRCQRMILKAFSVEGTVTEER